MICLEFGHDVSGCLGHDLFPRYMDDMICPEFGHVCVRFIEIENDGHDITSFI